MLTQHPITPAVNGRDGGLIHPLPGQLQASSAVRPLLRWVFVTQLLQQLVMFAIRFQKALRRFGQARTNTVAQFLSGGVRKRHHQDLRRRKRCLECVFAAMPQHQTHIKQSDREGFARAGTGLDQSAAMQWKV